MALLTTKTIKSSFPVEWDWPVEFGLLPNKNSNRLIKKIRTQNYCARLSYSFTLNSGRRKCNILILNNDLLGAINELQQLTFSIKCDLILLFVPQGESPSANFGEKEKILLHLLRANGLFIAAAQKDLPRFCDELVYSFSHNQNIRKSLEYVLQELKTEGMFFQSGRLQKATKLERQFQKMMVNIKGLPEKDLGPLTTHVFTEQLKARIQEFTQKDLETFIDTSKGELPSIEIIDKYSEIGGDFQFKHESDEASIHADIAMRTGELFPQKNTSIGFKKKKKKKKKKKSKSQKKKETANNLPRFLQCQFSTQDNTPIYSALECKTNYRLHVRIGPSDSQWLQSSKIEPTQIKFNPDNPEEIRIVVVVDKKIQNDTIILPAIGESTEALFSIHQNKAGEKTIQVFAYHRERLIQCVALNIHFRDDSTGTANLPPASLENIYAPRVVLDNLSGRMKFGVSIMKNITSNEQQLLINTKKGAKKYKVESGLDNFVKNLKRIIEIAATNEKKFPLDLFHPANFEVLKFLAAEGQKLNSRYLKGFDKVKEPIQVISPISEYIPIEFIYTKKISTETKAICPNAVQALKDGKCAGCNKNEAIPFLCPFGFVGLRNVIERHDIGKNTQLIDDADFGILMEPSHNRKELSFLRHTLFGASERLDKVVDNVTKSVETKIDKASNKSYSVDSWEKWKTAIKKYDYDGLVVIGHVAKHDVFPVDFLEIGQSQIQSGLIQKEYITRRAKKTRPIVILIGCGTQNLENPFSDFASSFKDNGAALVLSTFTKILGRHAGPMVEKLFDFFESRKGQSFRFGDLVLQLKQHLLSEGVLASLGLVAHGDADWIIKI